MFSVKLSYTDAYKKYISTIHWTQTKEIIRIKFLGNRAEVISQ